jgi:superfamily II DNA helicase RecQ
MSLHFFFVPAARPSLAQAELNSFLSQERVLTLTREFVADGANSGWALCVEVAAGAAELPPTLRAGHGGKRGDAVDYKQVLSAADFDVYAALRDQRKLMAQTDGVPVYAVFSNEQLAQIVSRQCQTLADLAQIEGVGQARVDKYGSAILACAATQRALPNLPSIQPAGAA